MNKAKTITKARLLQEVAPYLNNKPVYISVGGIEYPIDDIYLTADANGQNGKIIIETWEKEQKDNGKF